MSNEQIEHIAKRVSEITRQHPGENLTIHVIPPPTSATGYLAFQFAIEHSYPLTGSDDAPITIVRVTA